MAGGCEHLPDAKINRDQLYGHLSHWPPTAAQLAAIRSFRHPRAHVDVAMEPSEHQQRALRSLQVGPFHGETAQGDTKDFFEQLASILFISIDKRIRSEPFRSTTSLGTK
jgi:hypothetical protein